MQHQHANHTEAVWLHTRNSCTYTDALRTLWTANVSATPLKKLLDRHTVCRVDVPHTPGYPMTRDMCCCDTNTCRWYFQEENSWGGGADVCSDVRCHWQPGLRLYGHSHIWFQPCCYIWAVLIKRSPWLHAIYNSGTGSRNCFGCGIHWLLDAGCEVPERIKSRCLSQAGEGICKTIQMWE